MDLDNIRQWWASVPQWTRILLYILFVEVIAWIVGQALNAMFVGKEGLSLPSHPLFIANPYLIAVTFGMVLAYPFSLLWKRIFGRRPKLHISCFAVQHRQGTHVTGYDFIVRVQAFTRLTNGKIYAQAAQMASDWSGEQVVWKGADGFGIQIGEFALLRRAEHNDIKIGSRGPRANDPLNLLGADHNKTETTYPIDRLTIGIVSDELREERTFGILAPGYVYNGVVPVELVPMSGKVFSQLLEP